MRRLSNLHILGQFHIALKLSDEEHFLISLSSIRLYLHLDRTLNMALKQIQPNRTLIRPFHITLTRWCRTMIHIVRRIHNSILQLLTIIQILILTQLHMATRVLLGIHLQILFHLRILLQDNLGTHMTLVQLMETRIILHYLRDLHHDIWYIPHSRDIIIEIHNISNNHDINIGYVRNYIQRLMQSIMSIVALFGAIVFERSMMDKVVTSWRARSLHYG